MTLDSRCRPTEFQNAEREQNMPTTMTRGWWWFTLTMDIVFGSLGFVVESLGCLWMFIGLLLAMAVVCGAVGYVTTLFS